MTARLTADTVLNGGQRHPGRLAFFFAWVATRPRMDALWQTTALFGGVGCGVLHPSTTLQTAMVFVLAHGAAMFPLVPWFFADYRLNEGWTA